MATIQGIYIALFGRPADPSGLAFYNEATGNGTNLTAIGDLAASKEYQDLYAGLNNIQIISRIYQELFGRDPDEAGLAYYVSVLNSGTQNINTIAINILDGAQGDDAAIVANKVAAANLFTAELDTPLEIASYVGPEAAALGRQFLSTVTADPASVPSQADAAAAVANVAAQGVAGNTFEVGPLENVTVGTGPTNSTADNDTITVTDNYTAAGKINAGFGTDKVIVSIAGDVTTDATDLVSVEQLYVTATADATLDLTNTAGLKQVWSVNSEDNFLTIEGIGTDVTVGLRGATGAGVEDPGGNDVAIVFKNAEGDADVANFVLDGGENWVEVEEIETINLSVTKPGSLYLDAVDAGAVNVTGSGDFELSVAGNYEDLVVDASGLTGKLSFWTGGGDYDAETEDFGTITVIGTDFNDTFNLYGGAISATGGAGADQFNIYYSYYGGELPEGIALEDVVISIADFNGSEDTIGFNLGGGTKEAFSNVELSNIAAAATLQEAVQIVVGTLESDYATFVYKGDSYILGEDSFVQVVGFTGAFNDTNLVNIAVG